MRAVGALHALRFLCHTLFLLCEKKKKEGAVFIFQSANIVKVENMSEQECGRQRMKASNVCMGSGRLEDETRAGELMLRQLFHPQLIT